MPFYDKLNIGSIFREPRNRPARFNPERVVLKVREFSRQVGLPLQGRFRRQVHSRMNRVLRRTKRIW